MATRRRWVRKLALVALSTVGALLAAVVVVLVVLTQTQFGRDLLRDQIVPLLNDSVFSGHLEVGAIRGPVLGRIELTDVRLFDGEGRRMIDAPTVKVRYRIVPFLRNRVHLTRIEIEDADVRLRIDEDGSLNIAGLMQESESDESSGAPWVVDVDSIVVRNTDVALRTAVNDEARVAVVGHLETELGLTVGADGAIGLRIATTTFVLGTPVDLNARTPVEVLPLELRLMDDRIVVAGDGVRLAETAIGEFTAQIELGDDPVAPFAAIEADIAEVTLRPEELNPYLGETRLLAPLTLNARVHGPVDDVRVELPLAGPGGSIELALRFDLSDPSDIGYRGTARASRFQPNLWFSLDFDADISASIAVDGRGMTPDGATVGVRVELGPSRFADIPLDGAWFGARYDRGDVEVTDLRAWSVSSDVEGSAALSADGLVSVDLALRIPDLGELVDRVSPEMEATSGSVHLDLIVDGSVPIDRLLEGWLPESVTEWMDLAGALGGSGTLDARGVAVGDVAVASLALNFAATATNGFPDVGFGLVVAGAELAGTRVDSARVRGGLADERVNLNGEVSLERGSHWLAFDLAALLVGEESLDVAVRSLRARTGSIALELVSPTRAVIELDAGLSPTAATLSPTELEIADVLVSVAGSFVLATGAYRIDLSVPPVEVAPVLAVLGLEPIADGRVGFDIQGEGTLSRPAVEVVATAVGLTVVGAPRIDATVEASVANEVVQFDVEVEREGVGLVQVRTTDVGVPLNLDIERGVVEVAVDRPIGVEVLATRAELALLRPLMPPDLPAFVEGTVEGLVLVEGTIEQPTFSFELALDNAVLELTLDKGVAWRTAAIGLTAVAAYNETNQFGAALSASLGGRHVLAFSADSTLDLMAILAEPDEAVDRLDGTIELVLSGLRAEDLPPTLLRELGVAGGEVDLELTWDGSIRVGSGDLNASLRDIAIEDVGTATGSIRLQMQERVHGEAELEFTQTTDSSGRAPPLGVASVRVTFAVEESLERIVAQGGRDVPLAARLQLLPVEVLELGGAGEGADAPTVAGYVDLFGTVADPSLFGRVALRGVPLARGRVGVTAVEVQFANDEAMVTVLTCAGAEPELELQATVGVPVRAMVAGETTPSWREWPIELVLEADGADLAVVVPVSAVAAFSDDLGGSLDASVRVGGVIGRPTIDGQLALRGGWVSLLGLGRRFEGIEVVASVSGDSIELTELKISDERGQLRGDGRVALDELQPQSFEVAMRLRDFLAADESGAGVFLSGDIAVEGAFVTDGLDIEVVLTDLRVAVPDDAGGAAAGPVELPEWVHVVGEDVAQDQIGRRSPRPVVEPIEAVSAAKPTVIRVQVNTTNSGLVEHQLGQVRFTVDLGIVVAEDVSMSGRVALPSGSVRVVGNVFEIRHGSIVFSEDDHGIDPMLDILAVHELSRTVTSYLSERVGPPIGENATVQVAVRGRLSDLAEDPAGAIRLEADPGLSEADIFQVLASGRLASDTGSEEGQQGVAVFSSLLLGFVGDRLSGGMPLDTIQIEGTGESQRVEGGKYISDSVYVSGAYIRSPGNYTDNNFEMTLDWILREIGPGSLRLVLRGGDRAKGGLELVYAIVRGSGPR